MFALVASYSAQLQWTWERLSQPQTPTAQEEVVTFEISFMRETLQPVHFKQFEALELRCEYVLRTDPKIFVPGIAGLGHM